MIMASEPARGQMTVGVFAKLRAGFAKLWLRRTGSGWRINPHAVVGTIILLASLLLLRSVLLQEHTTQYVLSATIGPLGVWYVVHPNLGLLGRLWENPWGKLFYGLLASVTVTVGKIWADQEIRLMTQSNPSLFPSAQQAITVYTIINLAIAEISVIMVAPVIWYYLKLFASILLWPFKIVDQIFRIREMLGLTRQPPTSLSTEFMRALACVWGIFFILSTARFLNTGFPLVGDDRFNPRERLLLWSSFIPNDRGLAGSDRVCMNLPFDSLVSPFSTRDPIPNQVVMAQPISTGPNGLGHSYTYHVVECSKPTSRRGGFPYRAFSG
jgi:hypothetical protein